MRPITARATIRPRRLSGGCRRGRVSSGRLWPDEHTMRAVADRDASEEAAGAGVDRVDDVVVAARKPECAAVGRDAAHVWAAGAWQLPRARDAGGSEANDRDGAGVAIGYVQEVRVAADNETVCAGAGAVEADDA